MRGTAIIAAMAISLSATPALANQFIAYFEYGQATLRPDDAYLAGRVERYSREPGDGQQPWFSIYAHLDAAEEAEFGTDLDVRRAQAVASALVARGIDPARIRMFACGGSQLARPTPPGTAEFLNRRASVEINFGGLRPYLGGCREI